MRQAIFLIVMILFQSHSAIAQLQLKICFNDTDQISQKLKSEIESQVKTVHDSIDAIKKLHATQSILFDHGYLLAEFNNLSCDSVACKVNLFCGHQFEWAKIELDSSDQLFLSRAGWNENLKTNKPVSVAMFQSQFQTILNWADDNGYPFLSIGFKNVLITDSFINADLHLQKNNFTTIDSLKLHGDLKINNRFLQNYLGVKKGAAYCENNIEEIPNRLQELPWCSSSKSPIIIFHENKADVHLFANKRNASKFDFLLGFLPDNNTGKLLITGDGNLTLQNMLSHGELLHLQFNQFQNATTTFNLKLNYPFLFSLPVGADAMLDLYKRDSTYLTVKFQLGIQYLFVGTSYIKFYVRKENSFLLTVDTDLIQLTHQLPDQLDYVTSFYGIENQFEKLDYRLNPQKGWAIKWNGEIGIDSIYYNTRIVSLNDVNEPNFDYHTLYDSVTLKSTEFRFLIKAQHFSKLSKHTTALIEVNAGTTVSKNYFDNKLFRIGGFNSIRGFDDESVLAGSYSISTLEWRYLLDKNSYFSIFNDFGITQNSLKENSFRILDGFGAAISFQTRAGIFVLNYAIGAQENQPVQLRNAKIHFGYINYF